MTRASMDGPHEPGCPCAYCTFHPVPHDPLCPWMVALGTACECLQIRRNRAALAGELRELAANRDRTRPLRLDATCATDFASDFEWAAMLVEGSLDNPTSDRIAK